MNGCSLKLSAIQSTSVLLLYRVTCYPREKTLRPSFRKARRSMAEGNSHRSRSQVATPFRLRRRCINSRENEFGVSGVSGRRILRSVKTIRRSRVAGRKRCVPSNFGNGSIGRLRVSSLSARTNAFNEPPFTVNGAAERLTR